jgi:hypothetical protein
VPQTPYNQPVGLNYAHVPSGATTVVKSSPAMLQSLVFNSAVSGAVVTLYDNATGSGAAVIAKMTLPAITTPTVVDYGLTTKNGLVIVTATEACDLTVVFN